MATITINGTELDNDDVKTVRKALAKVRREEQKAMRERQEQCDIARSKAHSIGFAILARKASGQGFPRAWRLYRPGEQWAEHTFVKSMDQPETNVCCGVTGTMVRHYGYDFLGAVTGAAGYTQAIFLRDHCKQGDDAVECFAIGTAPGNEHVPTGSVHYLAELPGVKMSDFVPAGD